MNEEILADIRNKLTVPKTAFEKLSKGEQVPREFLELASQELSALNDLLKQLEFNNISKSKKPSQSPFSV
jgi:hypothetical protein